MENPKIFLNSKLEPDAFYMSPVEIIIPFQGEHVHVTSLMDSIFKTVYTNRYLITLVDDGSLNQVFIKDIDNAKIPGVRCFQQEQKGFGSSVNLALSNPYSSNIPWILIMRPEVIVEDSGWLISLGRCLNKLKSQGIKMVSPTTNSASVGFDFLLGRKGDKNPDHILTEGFLPMYSSLAHRELFNRVGPLKEDTEDEAEDYSIRMNKMGFKQAVCGSSWVNLRN